MYIPKRVILKQNTNNTFKNLNLNCKQMTKPIISHKQNPPQISQLALQLRSQRYVLYSGLYMQLSAYLTRSLGRVRREASPANVKETMSMHIVVVSRNNCKKVP